MFTGSVTANRITIGCPPRVRQMLYDEACRQGMKPSELARHVLLTWSWQLERERAQLAAQPKPTRADAVADYVRAGKPLPAAPPGPVAKMIAECDGGGATE